MNPSSAVAERRLLDRIAPLAEAENDPILGLVGTTYNLQPDFFDVDFLPALLGLGSWDDRGWTTRIAIEKRLQMMDSATIVMEAGQYTGRPRSLRVEVLPAASRAQQKLHAKVLVVLRERMVQIIAGSANLTEPGYRSNREVAIIMTASAKHRRQCPLMLSAVQGMRVLLSLRLTKGAADILARTDAALEGWTDVRSDEENTFAWSGGSTPLWQDFLSRWPAGEKVRSIVIVSPFWSEADPGSPVHRFLEELARKGALDTSPVVRLLTEAFKDSQGVSLPRLPASYATCDLSAFQARAYAEAVDPIVLPEEVDMREDFLGTRPLHAKLVLLEGRDTVLAYAGSANFTHKGWGFLADPTMANIEAGVILQRSGQRRAELQELIPATVGQAVELARGKPRELATPEASAVMDPWPDFIAEIMLSPMPDRQEELTLLVQLHSGAATGAWSVAMAEKGTSLARTLISSTDAPSDPPNGWRVPLDNQTLTRLLIDQQVLVKWWRWPQGRSIPINVAPSARTSLPISPGSSDLMEEHLIAYYQGRVRWEDLFPDPNAPAIEDGEMKQPRPQGSEVDTSKIQSYQIREFVEALSGIRADLREACQSEPAMRLAVLGPVSPISLARTVMAAVREGTRTPTAAGFQLVEILACIEFARRYTVSPRLQGAWLKTLNKAGEEIRQFLCRLREEHVKDFRTGGIFDRYERQIRECFSAKEGGI